jgi:hypothetical protein
VLAQVSASAAGAAFELEEAASCALATSVAATAGGKATNNQMDEREVRRVAFLRNAVVHRSTRLQIERDLKVKLPS